MSDKYTPHNPIPQSGNLSYNMMNDYMFRAVQQKNQKVLKGLSGALLHLAPESLKVEITNPIILGKFFENKDIIQDINVIINGHTRLNPEIQITNYHNRKLFPERTFPVLSVPFFWQRI